MKKTIFLLPFVLLIAFSSCNSGNKQQETEKQEVIDPIVTEIDVKGMTCTGCENAINKSVQQLEGIVEVNSSHVDEKTTVKYDETKVSVDQIKEAIAKAGYTVVEPEAKE